MQFDDITCPHCGLLCDDLSIEVNHLSLQVLNTQQPKCTGAYADASITGEIPKPSIEGQTVSLADAVGKAADILRSSAQPLVYGLITDIQGNREAVALTEKISGVLDHINGTSMRSSTSVMQRIGEVKTTLAEVKNRADFVIIIGNELLASFPRLVERILTPKKTLGVEGSLNKKIIILDVAPTAQRSPHKEYQNIECIDLAADSLESVIHSFQGIVMHNGKIDESDETSKTLDLIKQQILSSHYTTLVWTSSSFQASSAEYTVQSLAQIIKHLTKEVRCVGLPLGGSKAEVSANQVVTWQTGSSLPVAFMGDAPTHDPVINSGKAMLANGDIDSMLWIGTYQSEDTPPETKVPTIVLGHPNMHCSQTPAVFIPVGVPGIDHRGLACRTDNVATLPLKAIRSSGLPAASDVLRQITQLI
jgi:formylmethanofuran dehydrogenase subunit B